MRNKAADAQSIWKVDEVAALLFCEWPNEHQGLAYNIFTGATHQVSQLGLEILATLNTGPTSLQELVFSIDLLVDAGDKSLIATTIHDTLLQLRSAGLVNGYDA